MLKLASPLPLREVLTSRLTLASPTQKILSTLLGKVTDAAEKVKIEALLKPEAKEQLTAYLDEREYVDILAEFPSGRLTPQEFVDHLRKLMPRLYSIASSPKPHPQHVHLTVAIVRYRSNGRERVGVCSTFMADRAEVSVTAVPTFVSHSHFGLP